MATTASIQNSDVFIPGTAPNEVKELVATYIGVMFWAPKTFYAPVASNLRVEDISLVQDLGCPAGKRTVWRHTYTFTVNPDMLNTEGFLHEGCVPLIVDNLSSMILTVLRMHSVSLNFSINYMVPVKLDTTVYVVTTAIFVGNRVDVLRAELYDRSSGEIICTAEHAKMKPVGGPKLDAVFHLNTEAHIQAERVKDARLLVSDPSMIAGSAPLQLKQTIFDSLQTCGQDGVFSANIIRTMGILQIDEEKTGKKSKTSVICEIGISQSMTNGWGAMHGGCGCFLVTQMSHLVTSASEGKWTTSGLNVTFHAPAVRGSTIRLVATPLTAGRRIMNIGCEGFDAKSGRLLFNGSHTILRSPDQSRL